MGFARRLRTSIPLAVVAVGVPLAGMALGHSSAGPATAAGTSLTPQISGVAGTTVTNTVGTIGTVGTSSTAGTTGVTGSSVTADTSANDCTASTSNHLPADKVTVADSKIDEFGPADNGTATTTLLCATMRTSNVADLTFSVSLECSIVTAVTTNGNEPNGEAASGEVKVWVAIDGKAVGVIPATQGQSDDGQVVFCNRAYSMATNGFDEASTSSNQDPTITTYMNTKEANAFNWVALNVGSGIHTISVNAILTATTTNTKDHAQAVVGNRTVVVNTTQTAQNQS